LRRRDHAHQVAKSLSMDAPTLLKREELVTMRLGTEKGADLNEGAAETCGCGEGFEPTRGPVPLFDPPMILFQMVVQIAVGAVRHPLSEDGANGSRIGIMAIRGDAVGRHPGHRPGRAKKGLGRRQVPRVAEPRMDEMAVPVDGTLQIAPASLDSDIRLVYILAVPDNATTSLAQRLTQERGQLHLPIPHSFMRKNDAPLEKYLRQIPQAQLVAEAP
jgi:hypothetical protein